MWSAVLYTWTASKGMVFISHFLSIGRLLFRCTVGKGVNVGALFILGKGPLP